MRKKSLIFIFSGFDQRRSPKNCHIMKVNKESEWLTFFGKKQRTSVSLSFPISFFFYLVLPQHHFWTTTRNVGQGLLFFIWFYRNVRIFWYRVGSTNTNTYIPIYVLVYDTGKKKYECKRKQRPDLSRIFPESCRKITSFQDFFRFYRALRKHTIIFY